MECPHCHAKNPFRAVYGSSGSSMHYDEGNIQATVISGALCYNCGHWIEPKPKLVETRPIEEPKIKAHKPAAEHRKIASVLMNRQLMVYADVIFKLRDSGMGFRDIAAILEKKRVKVSYTKLRLWCHEMARGIYGQKMRQAT